MNATIMNSVIPYHKAAIAHAAEPKDAGNMNCNIILGPCNMANNQPKPVVSTNHELILVKISVNILL